MNLTTFSFLIFCFITIVVYFIVPKKFQWFTLLVSSIIFLFWDNFSATTVIQALIVLIPTYICGQLIEKYYNTKKSKLFLLIGIFIILGQLIYLKYSNLFLNTINKVCRLFNFKYKIDLVNKTSLIGISYYSLIMISYLIDIYRGTCKAQKNIFKCALFMSYFPILSSGPFIRYNNIEEDLYGKHKFNYKALCNGLIRVLWGLFKILVVSLRLGIFVDGVYSNFETYNGFYIIIAMFFFTLQLYTNFSGSIDIIMGVSEIFSINLPENFSLPFLSKTITEFWRNWHITLGSWLRDYIFYPLLKSNFMQKLNKKCKEKLGKNIGKKIPMYISMLIMWILIGIWHGGAYTFIIGSGLLQFLFIFLEDILTPVANRINSKLKINTEAFSYKLYQIIRTFILFSFSMIFFRANSVSEALAIIRNMFKWNPWIIFDNDSIYKIGLDLYDFRILIISLIIMLIIGIIAKNGNVREKLSSQNIVFRWIVLYSLIIFIVIFGCYGVGYNPANFIYRQF